MTAKTLTAGDVDRVATKLDALCRDLGEDDSATLHAIFAWAGRAVADEQPPEVSGFAVDAFPTGGGLSQSFAGGATHTDSIQIMSFSWGASNVDTQGGGTGGGAGKVDLSDINVTK